MPPWDVLQALRRRPFEPFRLVVSDGTSYTVNHPDLVAVTLGSLILGKPADGQPGLWERYETVSLRHIVSLRS